MVEEAAFGLAFLFFLFFFAVKHKAIFQVRADCLSRLSLSFFCTEYRKSCVALEMESMSTAPENRAEFSLFAKRACGRTVLYFNHLLKMVLTMMV